MTKHKEHQLEALVKSLPLQIFAFFMDMGTGKTKTALDWLYLHALNKVLVIVRREDFLTWETEIKKHHPNMTYTIVKGSQKTRVKKFQQLSRLYLTSYDAFVSLKKQIRKMDFEGVICDESTKVKRKKSQRFKAIYRYTRPIPYRVILTGTPSTNSIEDLVAQIMLLDDGQRLGKSPYLFKKKFFERVGFHEWILKKNSLERIYKAISDITYFKKADDCLDLPPEIHVTKVADWYQDQWSYYRQVFDDWEIDVPGQGPTLTEFAITRMQKLLQISSGFFYEDEWAYPVGSGKADILKDLIKDQLADRKKIVIWYSFKEERHIISNILPMHRTRDYKTDPIGARQQFQDDPNIQFILIPVQSGMGMNELVVADTAIYYSHDHKVEYYLQSLKRTRRMGSERHSTILYIHLITKDSIDDLVLSSLRDNRNILDRLMKMNPEEIKVFFQKKS